MAGTASFAVVSVHARAIERKDNSFKIMELFGGIRNVVVCSFVCNVHTQSFLHTYVLNGESSRYPDNLRINFLPRTTFDDRAFCFSTYQRRASQVIHRIIFCSGHKFAM